METPATRVGMEGGGEIALYRLADSVGAGTPVIVTHGTLSDASTVEDLGYFLSAQRFDVWLLDWGGHGQSRPATNRQNFEYPAFHDFPTALDAVLTAAGEEKLYWVAHSGGGLLPLMYFARFPEAAPRLAGVVTLGTQATDAARTLRQKVIALSIWLVTQMLGRTPRNSAGPEGEPTMLLTQWARWSLSGRWLGAEGFDYLQGIGDVDVPCLMIVGGNDRIAPTSGCRKLFDALGSSDKAWMLCSESEGRSKNFSHGQLVRGRAARAEVFPEIGRWLREKV